jgi:hypothetical protein
VARREAIAMLSPLFSLARADAHPDRVLKPASAVFTSLRADSALRRRSLSRVEVQIHLPRR